ncbi:hypothetical protein EV715DRAFT_266840 [Schizophyllum commune]
MSLSSFEGDNSSYNADVESQIGEERSFDHVSEYSSESWDSSSPAYLLAELTSGNIQSDKPLPVDVAASLAKVSPAGHRAVVSGVDNAHGHMQLQMSEHFMGLDPGTLNVNARLNLWFSDPSVHIGNDSAYSIFCPSKAELEQMLYAVEHHGLPIGETVIPEEVPKNSSGYALYTHAFPDEVREYHYIPLIGKNAWDAKTPVYQLTETGHKLYEAPFEDEQRIPPVLMHVNIYIMVICAYETLQKHNFSVKVPRHVHAEVELIKKIGKVMFKVADTLYGSPKRRSPFRVFMHRLRSGKSTDGASDLASVNTGP